MNVPAVRATLAQIKALAAANARRVAYARQDSSRFNAYVLRDERTGDPITQAPIHESWHRELATNPTRRTLIWSHVESGKTTQLSVGRTLYRLGKDPNLRVAIVSATEEQAKKPLAAISQYILRSEHLKQVFPDLQPGDGPWHNTAITVKRKVVSKDPSIQAYGAHGAVLGARVDLLILDDILRFENVLTKELRDGLWAWIQSTLMGRLTADAEVIVVGTAWHPEDAMHRFAALPGYKALVYPVVDEKGNPRWPERFPLERIEAKRKEMVPIEFARQLLCVARDDSTARFKREWIDGCIERGKGKLMAPRLGAIPPGYKTYTGVDLAVQQQDANDLTVLFTIAVAPNGDREVLAVESGRWVGPEIINRVVDHHNRYGSIVIVENNASQDFILQFARAMTAVPVKPYTTSARTKAHPEHGLESLAVELANKKWIIPSGPLGTMAGLAPELRAWCEEMLYYNPEAHTGDRLMASWFAREGIRMGTAKASTTRVDWQRR